MSDSAALLMRAITDELTLRVIPALQSADAIERATLARLVLQQLAADIDVLPSVAGQLVPEFRKTIEAALNALPSEALGGRAAEFRRELEDIPAESGLAHQREVTAVRGLAARIVRQLADVGKQPQAAAHGPQI